MSDSVPNHSLAFLGRLPEYLRESHLIGRPSRPATARRPARPAEAGILPFGHTTLWRKVNAGQFPKPVKLSENVTAWPAAAIRDWLKSQGAA